jgi:N-acetylneuraminic acid mutarotase
VIVAFCSATHLPDATHSQNNAGFDPSRSLSFAERIAYQTAIEDVYWRHRIWPVTNAGPKPSLDAVMSQAQIEKKVADYLRDSQALEDQWQSPITADQLQAEMERMASNTRQPEVLRELFEALGNDPFVIAECLARPILIQHLIADVLMQDKTGRFESLRTAETQMPNKVAAIDSIAKAVQVNRPYQLPVIASPSGGCIDDTWTPTSTNNEPAGRGWHTAVWTTSEMIVWGGWDFFVLFNTGGRYDPAADSWIATSTNNAPSARRIHTAVWTGSEMIVWGGTDNTSVFNTGGRYHPGLDNWTSTSTTNAPSARWAHTAVWTDSEMIVWGGFTNINCSNPLNTGGRYDPGTDSWTATSTNNASARGFHTAVWTGSEMIVWGGCTDCNCSNPLNTGGRYTPSTGSWTATSSTNAPDPRGLHTAVWTGSEMIVWGGYADPNSLNTGGRYNPITDSWTATSTTNVPSARFSHTAVWTDSEMIVWGGTDNTSNFNTGGRYDPGTDSWTATSTTNAPGPQRNPTAVWTDTEMIAWSFGGGRYCASTGAPTATPTPTATANATPTATATATPSATARPSPTTRPRPTPAPRP